MEELRRGAQEGSPGGEGADIKGVGCSCGRKGHPLGPINVHMRAPARWARFYVALLTLRASASHGRAFSDTRVDPDVASACENTGFSACGPQPYSLQQQLNYVRSTLVWSVGLT
jgi:hypothetical protein